MTEMEELPEDPLFHKKPEAGAHWLCLQRGPEMVDPEQTLSVSWSKWRQLSPAGLERELEGLQRPFWITDGTRLAVHG